MEKKTKIPPPIPPKWSLERAQGWRGETVRSILLRIILFVTHIPIIGSVISLLLFATLSRLLSLRMRIDCWRADKVQAKFLLHCLKANACSVYGKANNFSSIKSVEEYRRRVPLVKYGDISDLMDRCVNGELDVFSGSPPVRFCMSSGTSGKAKLIPLNKEMLDIVQFHVIFVYARLLELSWKFSATFGKGVYVVNATDDGYTPGGTMQQCITASTLIAIKDIAPYIASTPWPAYRLLHTLGRHYLHALFALNEPKLSFIWATFAYIVLDMYQLIGAHWRELIADLREGTIKHCPYLSEMSDFDREIMGQLVLKPNPKRAAELERIFSSTPTHWANKVWPRCHAVTVIAGGPMADATKALQGKYHNIPIFHCLFMASETVIGAPVRNDCPDYLVTPSAGFFEFIPEAHLAEDQPKTLLLHELKVGEKYELVITTIAGLARYRLGDVLQVRGKRGQSPLLRFCYRSNMLLFVSKTTEEQASDTIHATLARLPKEALRADAPAGPAPALELVNFIIDTVMDTVRGTFYRVFVEAGPMEVIEQLDLGKATHILDQEFRSHNEENDDDRKRSEVKEPILYFLRPGTFNDLRDGVVAHGASSSQAKVPHVVNKEWIRDLICRHVSVTMDVESMREWNQAPPPSAPSPMPSPIPSCEMSK